MCFSATASFGASAAIAIISVASFKQAATPAQRVLACIPLFFTIQQSVEGILWLSFMHDEYRYLYSYATNGFLFLALVVWPTMVPLAIMLPEPDWGRKKMLKILLGTGVIVSLAHLYCLLMYGVQASPEQSHIRYELYFPKIVLYLSSILYFIPALIPAFMSSFKYVRWLGIALVLSYVVTWIFYHHYIISVWCYFATGISVIVLLAIIQMNRKIGTLAVVRASQQSE